MKTIFAAAAIVLSATAGAYADSSLLDVYQEPAVQHSVDYAATASIGNGAYEIRNDRLGDGAPSVNPANRGTAISTGQVAPTLNPVRLGDGAPK
jgi:hypothetical protein